MTFLYSLLCMLSTVFALMSLYVAISHASTRFTKWLYWIWFGGNAMFATVFALLALGWWPI